MDHVIGVNLRASEINIAVSYVYMRVSFGRERERQVTKLTHARENNARFYLGLRNTYYMLYIHSAWCTVLLFFFIGNHSYMYMYVWGRERYCILEIKCTSIEINRRERAARAGVWSDKRVHPRGHALSRCTRILFFKKLTHAYMFFQKICIY